MYKISIHNKKIWVMVGVLLLLVAALLLFVSLKEAEESLKKVVTTDNNEMITFNLLSEGSETTLYQSDLVNLTQSQFEEKGVEYDNVYSGGIPEDSYNVKQYYQFYRDDNGNLCFYGEVYEWETSIYDNSTDSVFNLDRTNFPYEVSEDRGYVLVEFYAFENVFDEPGSHWLIKSKVNGKMVIAKTLSDFYYTGYKSYRILMEDIDSTGTDAIILADNVSEEYVVELIEFFAGI